MKKTRLILSIVAIMVGTLGALATTVFENTGLDPIPVSDVKEDCNPAGRCSDVGTACSTMSTPEFYREDGTCLTIALGTWTPN